MSERLLLVIGNKNYSSWSLRPWLLLRHHGIAFDEHRLLLDTPAFAREVGDWSPSRTVPALRHGSLTVWDSLAICEYASETFLDGAGWPREAAVAPLHYLNDRAGSIYAGSNEIQRNIIAKAALRL